LGVAVEAGVRSKPGSQSRGLDLFLVEATLAVLARPLRLKFAGAQYQVTSRGDGLKDLFRATGDRRVFYNVLGGVWEGFNWIVHA